ncbi:hypothetical protein ACFYMW_36250 [Streptomyces sp. NPDC006692]
MTAWLTRIVPSPTSSEARRTLSGNTQGNLRTPLHEQLVTYATQEETVA